jgi:hypothetical protein
MAIKSRRPQWTGSVARMEKAKIANLGSGFLCRVMWYVMFADHFSLLDISTVSLHGVTTQKAMIWILIAVKYINLTNTYKILLGKPYGETFTLKTENEMRG